MAFFDKTPAGSPPPSLTGRLVDDVTQYIDTRVALAKLDVQHSIRNALVGTLHGVTLGVLGLLSLVFLSIFAGLALNAALNSSYWGFGIVAGVYVLLAVIFAMGVDKGAFTKLAEKLLHDKIYKSEIEQARHAAAPTSTTTSSSSAA